MKKKTNNAPDLKQKSVPKAQVIEGPLLTSLIEVQVVSYPGPAWYLNHPMPLEVFGGIKNV